MTRRLLVPALFSTLGLAILLGLGFWQWQRRAEKEALITTIQQRIGAPAVDVSSLGPLESVDPSAHAYRPVRALGRFDHDREAHVFFALSKPKGGHSGPGFLIVTPFLPKEGGVILVNRGFVPQALKERASRAAGATDGEIEIVGLLRASEQRTVFSGADDVARNVFYVRNIAAIAAARNVDAPASFMLDLKAPAPPGGLPVPDVTLIDIPNNHLQYALTWWSLAGVLAAIFLLWARRSER